MDARYSLPSIRNLLAILALSSLLLPARAAFGASVNADVSLSRRGAAREILSFSPQVTHFKDVLVGQRYMREVVLTNHGRSTLTLMKVHRSNSIFNLRGLKVPLRVRSEESVRFEILFVPTRSGRLETNFTFLADHASSAVLHADANRVHGGLVSNPQKVEFGSVRVGSGERLPITLANSGSANQTISRLWVSGKEFGRTELNLPMTLAPGESITLGATFEPRWTGAASGEIVVDAGGASLSIPVAGQGSDSGHLGIAPAQLNFGNVPSGATVTLSGLLQAGRLPVTIYSAGITSSEFSLTGLSFPFTIAAGQSKTYQVTFSPGASGSISAALSFQGAPGLNAQETLAGNALPGTQHKVSLSWNPVGTGVVGYNIYRANASGGQYSQLNSLMDSNPSYLDSTVQGGRTYYYVTTAVAANGKQSAFSNQVEVVIP